MPHWDRAGALQTTFLSQAARACSSPFKTSRQFSFDNCRLSAKLMCFSPGARSCVLTHPLQVNCLSPPVSSLIKTDPWKYVKLFFSKHKTNNWETGVEETKQKRAVCGNNSFHENIHNASNIKQTVMRRKKWVKRSKTQRSVGDSVAVTVVRRKDAALGSDKPFFVCVFSRFLPGNTWKIPG